MAQAEKRQAAPGAAERARKTLFRLTHRVSLAQKIFFAENLRVMIRAGLSYTQAFRTLVLQAEQRYWKEILKDVAGRIERGETFAAALAAHEEFSSLFVNMVRVGEVSGTLDRSLEELVIQMKKDMALRSKVRGALMYPSIVLTATVGISIGMLIFVIPKILSIFKEINADLPLATRILIGVSTLVTNHGLALASALAALLVLIVALGRTPGGKRALHAILLDAWIVGPIVRKVNMARATRTLSTLLRTSVPVVDAFLITGDVVGNVQYRDAFRTVAEELRRGTTIAESFEKRPKLFPPLVTQMTSVGEQAGKLDEMLVELAQFYEAQVEDTLTNLSQIIEPALILLLGGAVGGIAVAIISPIYSLAEHI